MGKYIAVSGKFGDLLTYATFASLLFYILTIIGVFILRKEPDTERPYKAFGYPFVPAIYSGHRSNNYFIGL
jgi:APA family basic amino acid/polyamine antiporter